MLLAAVPGRYGDGGTITLVNKIDGSPNRAVTEDKSINTFMGHKMTEVNFKRFLIVPTGSEVTGLTVSTDG